MSQLLIQQYLNNLQDLRKASGAPVFLLTFSSYTPCQRSPFSMGQASRTISPSRCVASSLPPDTESVRHRQQLAQLVGEHGHGHTQRASEGSRNKDGQDDE